MTDYIKHHVSFVCDVLNFAVHLSNQAVPPEQASVEELLADAAEREHRRQCALDLFVPKEGPLASKRAETVQALDLQANAVRSRIAARRSTSAPPA